jgi:hypothetical protein
LTNEQSPSARVSRGETAAAQGLKPRSNERALWKGWETVMSRMEIGLPEGALLVVGWDPPLATFYAQVFERGTTHTCDVTGCFIEEQHVRRACHDELIELWVGMSHAELPTLEDLERALDANASSLSEAAKAELRKAQQLNE